MKTTKSRSVVSLLPAKDFWKPKSTAGYLIVFVLILIPIVTLLVQLIRYSVNVPWWDQLSFVDLMEKLHKGTLTLNDLWKQHNEHRLVVPQAFELLTGKVTSFNFRVPVLFNFIFAAGTFGLLLSLLKQTFRSKKWVMILAVPFAWIFFSPIQYVNWLWGFQLAFFMSVFFATLTIWLLTREKLLVNEKLFITTMLAASVTTYCNGNGMLIWLIGLAVLLWRRPERSKLWQWLAVGVVVCGSYLYKFHRTPGSPTLSMLIKEPATVIKYVLAYLGRNLATAPTNARDIAVVMLIVLVMSTVIIYRKGQLDKILSWLALAGFALLTGVLAAISRLNFGIDHGFNSTSYPTISLLFVLATIVIAFYALYLEIKDFTRPKLQLYLAAVFGLGVLCALPLTAIASNYATGTTNLKALSQHLRDVQDCVYTASSPADACLTELFPNQAQAWGYVQDLRALHWGNFK